MEYKSSIRWYFFQFLPVLPLALIALALHKNNDMLWMVFLLAMITMGYVLVIVYRTIKQIQTPVVALDDRGIRVRIYGSEKKDISWDSITDAHESSFCIKLTVQDREEPIPTNSLSAADKQSLLSEITARTIHQSR